MDEEILQDTDSAQDEGDRLPPPVFPPGSAGRRWGVAPRVEENWPPGGSGGAALAGALIQPDEPLPQRIEEAASEAVATGIDDDPHLGEDLHHGRRSSAAVESDAEVERLIHIVSNLLSAIRERGEAGLRTTVDMNRLEATLRAYCVGWLAGRRDGQST